MLRWLTLRRPYQIGDRRMIGHLVPLLRGGVELVRRERSDLARMCLKLGAIAFDQRRADVLPQRRGGSGETCCAGPPPARRGYNCAALQTLRQSVLLPQTAQDWYGLSDEQLCSCDVACILAPSEQPVIE